MAERPVLVDQLQADVTLIQDTANKIPLQKGVGHFISPNMDISIQGSEMTARVGENYYARGQASENTWLPLEQYLALERQVTNQQ